MRFSQEFIDKVRAANDLEEIIGQYTELKPSGQNLMALCPFPDHNEKSPSFSLSPSKQMYHCFGCKKGGNVFNFLQDYSGMSFPEAVEYLAERASIPLPKQNLSKDEMSQEEYFRQKKHSLENINSLASQYFQKQLQSQPPVSAILDYIQKRELSQEVIEEFQLGFAPDSWQALQDFFFKKSVPVAQAVELGLLKARGGEKKGHYDIYRNRLIFPIVSALGKTIGFGGRVLRDEDFPKYLNSPESLVFHKGKSLYGLNVTAKHIRAKDEVILVEGYMDLLKLYQAGIQNVAANLGTAFTLDHAKLLQRYTKNIVLLFDGDSAGLQAAERALPILLQAGLFARVLYLPDAMDPDDYIQKFGTAALREKLDLAQDLYISTLKRRLNNFRGQASEKIRVMDQFGPFLTKIADPRLQSLYAKDTAELLGESYSWVLRSVEKKNTGLSMKSTVKPVVDQKKLSLKAAKKQELEILNLCLLDKSYYLRFVEEKLARYLLSEEMRTIFKMIADEDRQNPSEFDRITASLASKVQDPSLLTKMLDQKQYKDAEAKEKIYLDCKNQLKKNFTKLELQKLKLGLKQNQSPENLKEVMNLIKNTKSPELGDL